MVINHYLLINSLKLAGISFTSFSFRWIMYNLQRFIFVPFRWKYIFHILEMMTHLPYQWLTNVNISHTILNSLLKCRNFFFCRVWPLKHLVNFQFPMQYVRYWLKSDLEPCKSFHSHLYIILTKLENTKHVKQFHL